MFLKISGAIVWLPIPWLWANVLVYSCKHIISLMHSASYCTDMFLGYITVDLEVHFALLLLLWLSFFLYKVGS